MGQLKKRRSIAASRRVFIVDDEDFIKKVLSTHLTKEGFEVIESCGGKGVFAEIEESRPELLISDISMPVVDGYQVLRYMTEHHETVPVVMVTGHTEISVAVDIMKNGAFDYITKPVRKDELLDTIHRAITHRDLLERNKELERQNSDYQLYLEEKVKQRTKALSDKASELKKAYAFLKDTNIQFVKVMAETIEAKDKYTRGHCDRMKEYCLRIGSHLKLDDESMERLEYATILHDLGKVSTRESVLNKPGKLTEDEYIHMREHSLVGEQILEGITLMAPVAKIVGAHHEHFDGSGYPRGLKGEEIPLESRVISVADLFDAMFSTRPYRKRLSIETVIAEMKRVAGRQLDPHIVDIFIKKKLYQND